MRRHVLRLAVGVAVFASSAGCLPGVEVEDGPQYLTDSHGASGVVHAFLELSKASPEYARYWKGALDWLIHVAQRDDHGRMTWVMSTTAPEGHWHANINVAGSCHVLRMFFAGYKACGDERYKQAGLAGVRAFTERFARQKETRLGTAWLWSHGYNPTDRSAGMLAGHSHGLGNPIDVLLDAYEVTGDTRYAEPLRGLLVNLCLRGKTSQKDGQTLVAWPALKNPDVVETGYCYGQAGVVLPLLRLAEAMPDLRLSDGATPLAMANASLRYLMSVARTKGDGIVWPYMRHAETTRNFGLGSGTGGIGWAFLRGAQVNRKTNPAFARECMRYARGAAVYATDVVLGYKKQGPLTSPGGDGGFGVCGGAGGGGHLLIRYAQDVGDADPDLVRRCNAATRKIARLVAASAETVDDGTQAIPDRGHFGKINIALDYGQTGVVLGLATAGRYLEDETILASARKVADYIVNRAAEEGGGLKFAQFHPLP